MMPSLWCGPKMAVKEGPRAMENVVYVCMYV